MSAAIAPLVVYSDLHLEFEPIDFPAPPHEAIVVLAGDIGVGTQGIQWARKTFRENAIVYVAGNHEFYRSDYHSTRQAMASEARFQNVHLLENSSVELGGIRFLGATFWTDFNLNGNPQEAMALAGGHNGLTDFKVIRYPGLQGRLTPMQTLIWHNESVAWLNERLAAPYPGPTVVVTHHGPTAEASPPQYRGGPLAPAFSSNQLPLMDKHNPSLWISGHTHYSVCQRHGGTLWYSNQAGYPRETSVRAKFALNPLLSWSSGVWIAGTFGEQAP